MRTLVIVPANEATEIVHVDSHARILQWLENRRCAELHFVRNVSALIFTAMEKCLKFQP